MGDKLELEKKLLVLSSHYLAKVFIYLRTASGLDPSLHLEESIAETVNIEHY